jgi:hypothetical protein
MCWGKKLRRSDSNRRPSGYEPDELPLLHAALRGYRTRPRPPGGSRDQWGDGDGDGSVRGFAVGVGVGLGFTDAEGLGVGEGGGRNVGTGTDTPPVAGMPPWGGTIT